MLRRLASSSSRFSSLFKSSATANKFAPCASSFASTSTFSNNYLSNDTRMYSNEAFASNLIDTEQIRKNPSNIIKYDDNNHEPHAVGDESKRAFSYFVMTGGRFVYASAVRLMVLKFILSMNPAQDVLAMASLEVDTSSIQSGNTVTVKWRGKPVFIRRRTDEDIAEARSVNVGELRDPEDDSVRAPVNPEWLVVVGVCTHLGCVPISNAGDYGGWFCPCHGSHYDVAGRIRKGPAPLNLEVPEYKFLGDNQLLIG